MMTYFGKCITLMAVSRMCVCSSLSDAWIRWTCFISTVHLKMDPTQPFPHVYWQTDMKNGFGSLKPP